MPDRWVLRPRRPRRRATSSRGLSRPAASPRLPTRSCASHRLSRPLARRRLQSIPMAAVRVPRDRPETPDRRRMRQGVRQHTPVPLTPQHQHRPLPPARRRTPHHPIRLPQRPWRCPRAHRLARPPPRQRVIRPGRHLLRSRWWPAMRYPRRHQLASPCRRQPLQLAMWSGHNRPEQRHRCTTACHSMDWPARSWPRLRRQRCLVRQTTAPPRP